MSSPYYSTCDGVSELFSAETSNTIRIARASLSQDSLDNGAFSRRWKTPILLIFPNSADVSSLAKYQPTHAASYSWCSNAF